MREHTYNTCVTSLSLKKPLTSQQLHKVQAQVGQVAPNGDQLLIDGTTVINSAKEKRMNKRSATLVKVKGKLPAIAATEKNKHKIDPKRFG